jgi:hypothetical protein
MIGLRELLLIGVVVLVLYGRSGVLKSRQAQTILPWISPVRRTSSRTRTSGRVTPGTSSAAIPRSRSKIPGALLLRGDRLYWFLTVLAATAVAAWIITRTLITSGSGAALLP